MFDPKCYDLAEAFLDEREVPEETKNALAQHIQTSIEDFLWALDNLKQEQG